MPHDRVALVIGGFGSIGTAVAARLEADAMFVIRTSRRDPPPGTHGLRFDFNRDLASEVSGLPAFDVVVWAQGMNVSDTLATFDESVFKSVFDANVTNVARSLAQLLDAERLRDGARLVVISSVWQQVTRRGRFSYTISKAAVGGLVRAASVELAARGILINAVLPSTLDTPMTRGLLSENQRRHFEEATGFGRLVTPHDVAGVVAHLCSPSNTGVTGESIAVDLGFSVDRTPRRSPTPGP